MPLICCINGELSGIHLSEVAEQFPEQSFEGNVLGLTLTGLINVGHFSVCLLDSFDTLEKSGLDLGITVVYEVHDAVSGPIIVLARVSAGIVFKDFLQYFEIVTDVEGITGILVTEEVVKIVVPTPGDRRRTQRSGLVGGEEDNVFGVHAPGFILVDHLVILIDRINLPMPQGIFGFVVGSDDNGRQI